MKLGASYVARISDLCNDLPSLNLLTAAHEKFLVMGVCRHPAMGVLNKQEVAKTPKFISGIGNNAGLVQLVLVPRSAKMFTPSFLNPSPFFPNREMRFPLTGI